MKSATQKAATNQGCGTNVHQPAAAMTMMYHLGKQNRCLMHCNFHMYIIILYWYTIANLIDTFTTLIATSFDTCIDGKSFDVGHFQHHYHTLNRCCIKFQVTLILCGGNALHQSAISHSQVKHHHKRLSSIAFIPNLFPSSPSQSSTTLSCKN